MVIIHQNNLEESMLLKMSVRICPSFWSQMALFRVLAHGLLMDASPSQDIQHEVTRSITTPPGWDASPSQDTQHEVNRSITTPP